MLQTDQKTIIPRITFVRLMVFWSSFALMVMEIAAGRVMAPYLGVSLYTWTSVIGAVLFGVTLGSACGGRLADRFRTLRPVGIVFVCAAAFIVGITALAHQIGPWFVTMPLPAWAATLLFCVVVFFPGAFLLSLIPPQAAKRELADLAHVGSTVGGIGAWSSMGSIVGTFIAGFILVQYMPTSQLLYGTAVSLLACSFAIVWYGHART